MAMSGGDKLYVVSHMLSYPALYRAELAGLPAEPLRWKPSDREWSLNEVMAHLAETEEIYHGQRLSRIVRESSPRFDGFDQEQYAIDHRYNDQDAMASLARFTRYLAANACLALEADWDRIGVHSEAGPLSFGETLMRLCGHHASHLNQMRRVRLQYLRRSR